MSTHTNEEAFAPIETLQRPQNPETPEGLHLHVDTALQRLDTYAEDARQIPDQTIDTVNTITNLPQENLAMLMEQTGFTEARTGFRSRLEDIARGARNSLQKLLIMSTLLKPPGVSTEAFAQSPDIEPRNPTESTNTGGSMGNGLTDKKLRLTITEAAPTASFENPEQTVTKHQPQIENVSTTTPEKIGMDATEEQRQGATSDEQTPLETIGDRAMYEEKLTSLRHNAENSSTEQGLVIMKKKDGSYVFREYHFSSSVGGIVQLPTEKEMSKITHLEVVHTHPYGMDIPLDSGERTVSQIRCMPPSTLDIASGIETAMQQSLIPENYSLRVIDALGDWTYTVDTKHPFIKRLQEFGNVFVSQCKQEGLLLNDDDTFAIEKSGLTTDFIRQLLLSDPNAFDARRGKDPQFDKACTKIMGQKALRDELGARYIPHEKFMLRQFETISNDIMKFDNADVPGAESDANTPEGKDDQRVRVERLHTLCTDMGITINYTQHEKGE